MLLASTFANLVPATPVQAEAPPSDLARLRASDLRFAAIGFRLATANAARCDKLMPATGMILHSLAQYGPGAASEAKTQWSFPSPVSLEAVVPGSPADRAGLHAGDGLEAVSGQALAAAAPAGKGSTFLRDAAEDTIHALPATAPIRLTLRRGEELREVVLHPVPACRTRMELVAGSAVKARSDGATIQVGQAFAERLDGDGLAVTLAHELAHTILDHRARLAPLEQAGADGKHRRERRMLARRFEDEADILSLDLLAAGGWNPLVAPRFMRGEGRRFDPLLPGAGPHRSAADRARRMERALDAKQR